jgi:hypothetical protein
MIRFVFLVSVVCWLSHFVAGAQTIVGAAVPLYPPLARAAKVQGDVTLEATAEDGRISAIKIVSGHRLLSDAAAANVRTWMLVRQVPMTFRVDFRYRLSETCHGNPAVVFDFPTKVEVCSKPNPPID